MEWRKILPWRQRGQRWRKIARRVDEFVEVFIHGPVLTVETVY
jgi:hypothetical protein